MTAYFSSINITLFTHQNYTIKNNSTCYTYTSKVEGFLTVVLQGTVHRNYVWFFFLLKKKSICHQYYASKVSHARNSNFSHKVPSLPFALCHVLVLQQPRRLVLYYYIGTPYCTINTINKCLRIETEVLVLLVRANWNRKNGCTEDKNARAIRSRKGAQPILPPLLPMLLLLLLCDAALRVLLAEREGRSVFRLVQCSRNYKIALLILILLLISILIILIEQTRPTTRGVVHLWKNVI